MKQNFKPEFSIITPLYNTADYFKELSESMENQTISFEENVQWILIDDGSEDNTGALCDEFEKRYPDNVTVIHQDNRGSAEARNAGIKISCGKYTGFLDADDMLAEDALEKVAGFFKVNAGNVDIAAIPIYTFEAKEAKGSLSYKFGKKDRIIHLVQDYDKIQTSLVSVFAKTFLVKKLQFEDNSVFSDIPFLIRLIRRRNNLGVVTDTQYRKRIRISKNSQRQIFSTSKQYYTEFLEKCCLGLLNETMAECGYIPYYVQYTVMYEIQWRIKENDFPQELFTDEEKDRFFDVLKEVLSYIDDRIILEQKVIRQPHKTFVLYIKHGIPPMKDNRFENILLHYYNTVMFSAAVFPANINFIKIKKNILSLEGVCSLPVSLTDDKTDIYFKINGNKVNSIKSERTVEHYSLGRKYMQGSSFKLEYDLTSSDEPAEIKIYNTICGNGVLKSGLNFARFSPISRDFANAYYYCDGYIVYADKYRIIAEKCSMEQLSEREEMLENEMLEKATLYIETPENDYESEEQETETDKIPYIPAECRMAVRMRHWYFYLKSRKKHQIWLLSDRVDRADDNGEAMFRYLRENAPENVDVYFVIDKNCDDYKRLEPLGNIIASCSRKHLMLHLLADYILSSQGNEWVENPFGDSRKYFRDLYHQPKYICLQHGITKDDQTSWLNRFNKDIYGLIASCKPEYDSFLEYPYYYTEKEIWLTGMPRYDLLHHNEKRYITIMPTWRKTLMSRVMDEELHTPMWVINDDFEQSSYFRFYNELVNNEKLLENARRYGYTICFMPHTMVLPKIDLFTKNPDVIFFDLNKSCREVFAESDLMVTDYSSVAFDFAYLEKPVVYSQFDREEFFAGHSYSEGYFDYERDGFGEVAYNAEDTVELIIEYMKNGCKLKPEYKKRSNEFFAFQDKNCCRRICDKIIENDEFFSK